MEKLALESQVGDLTLELNEKNAQLEEKDSVIQEKIIRLRSAPHSFLRSRRRLIITLPKLRPMMWCFM